MQDKNFRSGIVALFGRPNAGKSRLLNRLVGEKIAIISPRAQTTRNRITGIINRESSQLILFDTPGIVKKREDQFAKYMEKVSRSTAMTADIILFILDGSKFIKETDLQLIHNIETIKTKKILAINKIDLMKKKVISAVSDQIGELVKGFDEMMTISAKTGENIDKLIDTIEKHLPEGLPLYPTDMKTDQTEQFFISEIIREKAIKNLQDELPYSIAVRVEKIIEKSEKLVTIFAEIIVERESQKGIVVGKKAAMIKKIGTQAREELEKKLMTKVYLDLKVKTNEKWRLNQIILRKIGYNEKDYD